MRKLRDLEVERVDGVHDPATGQQFLILKAEEPDELRENVRNLLTSLERALHLLAKDENALTEETAQAFNEVARALDLDLAFKAKKPKEEEEEEGYGYPEPKKPKAEKAEEAEAGKAEKADDIRKALAELLDEKLATWTEQWTKALQAAPVTKAQSRQVQAQDAPGQARKLGEGLFTDIVFGGE